jgi:hypothetical protein
MAFTGHLTGQWAPSPLSLAYLGLQGDVALYRVKGDVAAAERVDSNPQQLD